MDSVVQLAATSMEALSEDFRGIAHNLANVSTVGYKCRRTAFAEALRQAGQGQEVRCAASIDFSQGALNSTGRPLDLAIQGKGFFVIETPDGPLYTRNGVFRLNSTGQLVDSAGRLVAGDAGPIVIPPSVSELKITVASDGTVSADNTRIGRLRVVEFADASSLRPVGGSCYQPAQGASPTDDARSVVHQGCQEASNVSAVEELVHLITVTRLYQANVKSIEATDERKKYLLEVAVNS